MKKLILVVTITVLGILACKKKDETPAPIVKKYEYKRTSGEVTKIEGDIFVDTGGTVFTVKGKGFDPSKNKSYHLLLEKYCSMISKTFNINGYSVFNKYVDTARIEQITDSTIKFKFLAKNVFTVRDASFVESNCFMKDSVTLVFAVTSKDSTNPKSIVTKFDVLHSEKTKNKLFFNILGDTLHWHTKTSSQKVEITLDDVKAGVLYGDNVKVYFNDQLLNSGNRSILNFTSIFSEGDSYVGDCFFRFQKEFYDLNKSIVPVSGFYNIKMEESKTGLPIEEKRGKKGVYVKLVD